MKKLLFILLLFFQFNYYAQEDSLYACINGNLIKISQITGAKGTIIPVSGFPSTGKLYQLKYAESIDGFYTLIFNPSLTNQIAKISLNGNYTILGSVYSSTHTIYHLEGLAYNAITNKLYASARCSNGVTTYTSNYLLSIDPITLEATIIGQFSHTETSQIAEADHICISNNFVYYSDTDPSIGFTGIYRQSISMTSPPELIYSENNTLTISDLTIKDNKLFYTSNGNLKVIQLSTNLHSTIGNIHSSMEFNGENIMGLDWVTKRENSLQDLNKKDVVISIYPNPISTNTFYFVTNSEIEEIQILDLNGKFIDFDFDPVNKKVTLLNSISNSNLTIQFKTQNGFINKKIVLI
ncbi:MAG: T9SS type A sorting domain-containing protein [Fluviicola sp.]